MCFRFWLGCWHAGLYGLYVSTGSSTIRAGAAAGAAAREATVAEATTTATEGVAAGLASFSRLCVRSTQPVDRTVIIKGIGFVHIYFDCICYY